MKTITERETWLLLAKCFRKVQKDLTGDYYSEYVNSYYCTTVYGLCSALKWLQFSRLISHRTKTTMLEKIKSHNRYRWPKTRKGAKQRVAFCMMQARKLKKGK